jgi:nicotinamide riboside kinase
LVIVVGGECSGKTTLCDALGQALPALVIPETLRIWCNRHGRTPEQAEQRSILAMQLNAERAGRNQAKAERKSWLICDGAPLLTAAYSSEYFGDESLRATGLRHAQRADYILLADPAVAWQADGALRDGPGRRNAVHARLGQWLSSAALPFQRVAGNPAQRLRACLALLR